MIDLSKFKIREPIHSSRFILNFPKEFQLDPSCVQKLSPIKYNFKTGWEEIVISIYDIIEMELTKTISENIRPDQRGTFILNKLDPCGESIEKIQINSKLVDINFGEFDYASNELNVIKLTIKPMSIIISHGKS